MSVEISSKAEVFFLTIFRWVVLLTLLAMFIVMGYFAINGVREYPILSAKVELERKSPPKSLISKDDFLKDLNSKKNESETELSQPVVENKKGDEAESNFLLQVEKLWTYVSKYQTDCQLQDTFDKEQFIQSMRDATLKEVLEEHDYDFTVSQASFVKEVLGSKSIVDLCKSGKKGIFISLLDYHLNNWNRQVAQIQEFEDREKARISELKNKEELRIALQLEEAKRSFIIAGIAFLIFMGISIILIFARIESNLRGVQFKN